MNTDTTRPADMNPTARDVAAAVRRRLTTRADRLTAAWGHDVALAKTCRLAEVHVVNFHRIAVTLPDTPHSYIVADNVLTHALAVNLADFGYSAATANRTRIDQTDPLRYTLTW